MTGYTLFAALILCTSVVHAQTPEDPWNVPGVEKEAASPPRTERPTPAQQMYQQAVAAEEDPNATDVERAKRWCTLFKIKKQNPHRDIAKRHCYIWRHFQQDYADMVHAVEQPHLAADAKALKVEQFIQAYPEISMDERVSQAKRAHKQLVVGKQPKLPVQVPNAFEDLEGRPVLGGLTGFTVSALLNACALPLAVPWAAVMSVLTAAAALSTGVGGFGCGLLGALCFGAPWYLASAAFPALGVLVAPACQGPNALLSWLAARFAGKRRVPVWQPLLAAVATSSVGSLLGVIMNGVVGALGVGAAAITAAGLSVVLARQGNSVSPLQVLQLPAAFVVITLVYGVLGLVGNTACVSLGALSNMIPPLALMVVAVQSGRGVTTSESLFSLDLLDVPEPTPDTIPDFGVTDKELRNAGRSVDDGEDPWPIPPQETTPVAPPQFEDERPAPGPNVPPPPVAPPPSTNPPPTPAENDDVL